MKCLFCPGECFLIFLCDLESDRGEDQEALGGVARPTGEDTVGSVISFR